MTAAVSATWTSPTGSQCVATGSGGHSIVMDAPDRRNEWSGFKPSELLLAALLGCTRVDFTSILAKQRQEVTQPRRLRANRTTIRHGHFAALRWSSRLRAAISMSARSNGR